MLSSEDIRNSKLLNTYLNEEGNFKKDIFTTFSIKRLAKLDKNTRTQVINRMQKKKQFANEMQKPLIKAYMEQVVDWPAGNLYYSSKKTDKDDYLFLFICKAYDDYRFRINIIYMPKQGNIISKKLEICRLNNFLTALEKDKEYQKMIILELKLAKIETLLFNCNDTSTSYYCNCFSALVKKLRKTIKSRLHISSYLI